MRSERACWPPAPRSSGSAMPTWRPTCPPWMSRSASSPPGTRWSSGRACCMPRSPRTGTAAAAGQAAPRGGGPAAPRRVPRPGRPARRGPGWGAGAPGWGAGAPGWGAGAPGWGAGAPGWGAGAPGWGAGAPGWGAYAPGWGAYAPGWRAGAPDRGHDGVTVPGRSPPDLSGARIAIANWRDPWHPQAGGAERFAWEMARGLAERGAKVCFLTARPPGQARREGRDGIEFMRIGGGFTLYPLLLCWLLAHPPS